MQLQFEKILHGDADTQSAGQQLAAQLQSMQKLQGTLVTFSGELGAGKTTFTRGFIQACGHQGAVKSPTYTLIETYTTPLIEICHLDLYRLEDPEELDFIGFRDLLEADNLLLIEWPERVPSVAALATIKIEIEHRDSESRLIRVFSEQPFQPD